MKPFYFNEQHYTDFNELGNAFIDNYEQALMAIKTKEFISFAKSNKEYKPIVFDALYESKTLQSVLAIIIYAFTGKLIIGGKSYNNIDEIIDDLDTNECVRLFLEDKGLRKTILPLIEDETLKLNFMSVEDNHFDEFSYKYLRNYKLRDPNVNIDELNNVFTSKDKFQSAYQLFKNEDFLLKLTYKYNLTEVMKIRRAINPVFDGLNLVKEPSNIEDIMSVVKTGFYLGLGKTYGKFKYKSIRALDILDEVSKRYKKAIKSDDLMAHKEFYLSYLKFVELYNKQEIVIKKKYVEYDFNIPYCDTFINNVIVEKYGITNFNETKEEILVPCYSLSRLRKAIKQHQSYIRLNIIFVVISAILYLITYIIPPISRGFNGVFGVFDIVFLISIFMVLSLTIVIFVKNKIDERRYNELCKLRYYRKNYNVLTKLQKEDMERILSIEDIHSKKADHYYAIIGSFVNSFLAIASSLLVIMIIVIAVPLLDEGFIGLADLLKSYYIPAHVNEAIDPQALLMPAIASTLPLFFGIIRHKKSRCSNILSVLFGILVTIIFTIIL